MTVPEARANAQLRRYDPRSLRIPFGATSLRVVVPAAREFLRRGEWARSPQRGRRLDARQAWSGPEHESQDWEPPYWVEVWPSARAVVWALARWAGTVSDPGEGGGLEGFSTLDLGCGVGVPGIAAAHCGSRVLFQDRSADALAFAGWNGGRAARSEGAIGAVEGAWEDPATLARVRDWLGQRANSVAAGRGGFDLVLMADVSYHVPGHDALLQFVESVVAADGLILHADPERADSTRFLDRLFGGGLVGARDQFEVVRTVRHEDRTTRVRLVVAGSAGDRRTALVQAIGAGPRTVGILPGRLTRGAGVAE